MFATGVLAQGVTVQSGDLKFNLQGYGQANYNVKNTNDETTNKFELTRVILMPNLQLTPKLNFFAMIDIASKSSDKYMHEYWGQYRFCDAFKVKFGQGKIPFSIENPLAPIAVGNIFFHEGLAYLVGIGGDASYGNFVGRDLGLSVGGDLFKSDKGYHHLSYSVGVFNGSGMNQAENNNQKILPQRSTTNHAETSHFLHLLILAQVMPLPTTNMVSSARMMTTNANVGQ